MHQHYRSLDVLQWKQHMKWETAAMFLGLSVASALIVDYITSRQNAALPTCKGALAKQPTATPLSRTFAPGATLGTKSAVEAEMQECPLGQSCRVGGVCTCSFCKVQPNGFQNTPKSQSGALQSWGSRPFSCGRTTCYAAAIKSGKTCSSQVVATQGAAGTNGWGTCADFASCC
jgi:hypothetical protein